MRAARIRRLLGAGGDLGVEVTPLIDMMFLLLIFFLVATTFERALRVLDVELPAAETGEAAARPALRVELSAVEIAADGRGVELDELRLILAATVREGRPVVIESDRRVPYERFVQVLDLGRAVGVRDVSLATRKDSGDR